MSKYLDQIAARMKLATSGPWECLIPAMTGEWPTGRIRPIKIEGKLYGHPMLKIADAEFIAHSRTDCEILLSRLRTAIEALEKLRDGPGNNMVSWRQTWAHEFSSKALQELSAPPSESELG
jgi:hypothetical protein